LALTPTAPSSAIVNQVDPGRETAMPFALLAE